MKRTEFTNHEWEFTFTNDIIPLWLIWHDLVLLDHDTEHHTGNQMTTCKCLECESWDRPSVCGFLCKTVAVFSLTSQGVLRRRTAENDSRTAETSMCVCACIACVLVHTHQCMKFKLHHHTWAWFSAGEFYQCWGVSYSVSDACHWTWHIIDCQLHGCSLTM